MFFSVLNTVSEHVHKREFFQQFCCADSQFFQRAPKYTVKSMMRICHSV